MLAQLFGSKPTRFDLPLAIFLATALLAFTIAYDRLSALPKLAMLVFSVWLYYAITGRPRQAIRHFPGYSCWLGALIAVYFLFTNSWQMAPAEFTLVQTAARIWTRLTPHLLLPDVHPNHVGGLLAILFPFSVLHLYLMRKNWHSCSVSTRHYLITWMVALILVGGLLMTGSRGAWLSLFLAAILCLSWLGLRYFARRISPLALSVLVVSCLLVVILAGGWLLGGSAAFHSLLDRFQESATINSRLDLYRNTLPLIADFPYTGSGLNTFAGLYSRYILSIPVDFFFYAHNLYLDLLLEQGPLALLAVLAIYLPTAYHLLKSPNLAIRSADLYHEPTTETHPQSSRRLVQISGLFYPALLTSMLTLLLHGLIDDPLYNLFGAPFLFIIPAMTVGLERFRYTRPSETVPAWSVAAQPGLVSRDPLRFFALAFLGLISAFAVVSPWRDIAVANWHFNVGNISMARFDLDSFPGAVLDERYDGPTIAATRARFYQALKYAPNYPGAHYRLGLIAYRLQDFPAAAYHFEKAYRAGLDHSGVLKHLAYSYVWSGHLTTAMPLLIQIPEAGKEMVDYTSRWQNLAQLELSERAQQAAFALSH